MRTTNDPIICYKTLNPMLATAATYIALTGEKQFTNQVYSQGGD